MSDWTSVTSKKKPPSVGAVELQQNSSPSSDSPDDHITTHLCAEFYIHAGSKTFNPALALRGLYQAMQQQRPDLQLFSVDGKTTYYKPEDVPLKLTKFEHQFPVVPHLGRLGSGKILSLIHI